MSLSIPQYHGGVRNNQCFHTTSCMISLSSSMVRRTLPDPVLYLCFLWPLPGQTCTLCSLRLPSFGPGVFRGVDDLRDGIIRTPLPPMTTFQDDPLRVLRAVRFAARFGFTLHDVRVLSCLVWSCQLINIRAVRRYLHYLSPIAGRLSTHGMCRPKC